MDILVIILLTPIVLLIFSVFVLFLIKCLFEQWCDLKNSIQKRKEYNFYVQYYEVTEMQKRGKNIKKF